MSSTTLKAAKLSAPISPPSESSTNSWKVLLEVARVHKPAGVLAFHVPLMLGSFVSIVTEVPPPKYLDGTIFFAQLSLSSLLLRSAACAWNDAADYRFDSQVARSRSRPIPRGAVTPTGARLFAAALTVLWGGIVWQSSPQALYTLVPNFLFNVAYPFAKRFTDYPQLFLGFTFSCNILTGFVMTTRYDMSKALQAPQIQQSLGYLALANVAWTVFYDMIYAYQDVADDQKAGVRSIALQWRAYGKAALALLASMEIGSLVMAGFAINTGSGYYVCSCLGSALVAAVTLRSLDLASPEDCGLWFKRNLLFGGIAMCSGFVAEYAQRL
ncbi:Para-hydroxybenzoate--polyprenyltransferase, mitochondrial precursor (PHB:polyprenyltransferase) [Xylographa soralifera]|nr:Para-hydroxybenzoate--polyprenyltransferase, mitochondrial precursor (PHB:polyprenyltransferase) [Xylographa soralifera]